MDLFRRLSPLVRRRRFEREMDEELRFHLEERAADLARRGLPRAEAERQARLELGSRPALAEHLRESRGLRLPDEILQDLRYAARMFRRNPLVTAAAVLSIALGVGANTAMFSFADALLLRPLPIGDPGGLLQLFTGSPADSRSAFSLPDVRDVGQSVQAILPPLATHNVQLALSRAPGTPARGQVGRAVHGDLCGILRIQPALGRCFAAEEQDQPVVLLSDRLWRAEFGADPGIVGRGVWIGKREFTVLGVLPAGFTGLHRFVGEDLFAPAGILRRQGMLRENDPHKRDHRNLLTFARLRPGFSLPMAEAELAALGRRLAAAYPETNKDLAFTLQPELASRLARLPEEAVLLSLLLALSLVVLAIACANVANLLLARARARTREIAVRAAIGAGRARLIRQMLTESLLLGALGAAGGLALGWAAIQWLAAIRLPTTVPIGIAVRLDGRVLAFSLSLALLASLAFGLAPAFRAARAGVVDSLKTGDALGAGPSRRWHLRDLLVAGQVAGSTALLILAGLLVKDFRAALACDPGFRTRGLLLMTFDPGLAGYPEEEARQLYRRIQEQAAALPGVDRSALAEIVPMGALSSARGAEIEGFVRRPEEPPLIVDSNVVGEDYFDVIGTPVVEGRAFDRRDGERSAPVAIVNQFLAARYWPGRSALGGRIKVSGVWREVVGIARDSKPSEINTPPSPFLYLPFGQVYIPRMTLHVLTRGDENALAAELLPAVRRIDRDLPVEDTMAMRHHFEEGGLFVPRLLAKVVSVLGALGLVLAASGLYAVVAYAVSRRQREIGIRMALGASRETVLREVLSHGLVRTVAGLVAGLGLAAAAGPALRGLLAFVPARDPALLLGVPVALLAVSVLATLGPALRASHTDPLRSLRCD